MGGSPRSSCSTTTSKGRTAITHASSVARCVALFGSVAWRACVAVLHGLWVGCLRVFRVFRRRCRPQSARARGRELVPWVREVQGEGRKARSTTTTQCDGGYVIAGTALPLRARCSPGPN